MAIDFPNSPTTNQLYTVGSRSWKWDGETWNIYAATPAIYVQDSAPTSPIDGDQWYESDTGRWFLRYQSVWVEIGNATDIAGALQPGQVTALSAVTSLTSDDVFPVVDNPASATASNKITYGDLVTNMSSSLAPGLVLIKTQAVGSGVSVVDVTDAFSSTYANYRVTYSGGVGSTSANLDMQFGIGLTFTATNYFGGVAFINVGAGAWQLGANNGGSSFIGGTQRVAGANMCLEIQQPNIALDTYAQGPFNRLDNGQVGNTWIMQSSTNQYTSFRLTTSAGTITGGTIRVYGYRNSL
jgi:hypothetical protein